MTSQCYHRNTIFIMHILFIGDIFGRPGRNIVKDRLPSLVKDHAIDLVIANGENSAGGFGITGALNHIWDKREIIDYFQSADGNQHSPARRLLRPANYAPDMPGWGVYQGGKNGISYAVVNLQGRVFMAANDDPFRVADQLLKEVKAKVIFVDFHAEPTSEKLAMGWYLDGRVTALVGTHTHIPTADERIMPAGTAYITDVGMTGPYDSVIGVQKEMIIARFLNNMPARFEAATGDVRLCAVVVDCDETTGRSRKIERLMVT